MINKETLLSCRFIGQMADSWLAERRKHEEAVACLEKDTAHLKKSLAARCQCRFEDKEDTGGKGKREQVQECQFHIEQCEQGKSK